MPEFGLNLDRLLGDVLDTARDMMDSDMSNLQLLDESGILRVRAHDGFADDFLNFFSAVSNCDDSCCSAALAHQERIIVTDVTRIDIFAGTPSPGQTRLVKVAAPRREKAARACQERAAPSSRR